MYQKISKRVLLSISVHNGSRIGSVEGRNRVNRGNYDWILLKLPICGFIGYWRNLLILIGRSSGNIFKVTSWIFSYLALSLNTFANNSDASSASFFPTLDSSTERKSCIWALLNSVFMAAPKWN